MYGNNLLVGIGDWSKEESKHSRKGKAPSGGTRKFSGKFSSLLPVYLRTSSQYGTFIFKMTFFAPASNVKDVTPLWFIAEPFSSLSHITVAICLVLSSRGLARNLTCKRAKVGSFLYVLGTSLTMAISGIYHMIPPHTFLRLVFRRLDHAMIFFGISAVFSGAHFSCFTTFPTMYFTPIILWTCALIGTIQKTLYFDLLSDLGTTVVYLACGWLGLISSAILYAHYGKQCLSGLLHLLLGGIYYSVGAVVGLVFRNFVVVENVIHAHEVFHILCALGVYRHFRFVKFCLTQLHPMRFTMVQDRSKVE
ncbi:hypothetical protein RCL1_005537 [Eukaryota sp. TZLM3-RCL]